MILNPSFQPATDDPVCLITAQGKATLREYEKIPSDILAYEIRPFDVLGVTNSGKTFYLDSFCEESEARAFIEFYKKATDCPYNKLEIVAP